MKKFMFLIYLSTFIGCANISNLTSSNNSSTFVQEKINLYVSSDEDLYGVGSAKITSSGDFIAVNKAKKVAKDNLKSKVSEQVNSDFAKLMAYVDPYSATIYNSAKEELKTYIIDSVSANASEKEAFSNDGKIYIVSVVNKEDIFRETKFAFNEYTTTVFKRLEEITFKLKNINYIVPDNNEEISLPKQENVTNFENNSNLEEDPLLN